MRVMCIQDKPQNGPCETDWRIKTGEIYEVVGTEETKWGIVYVLDIHPGAGYWPEYFARVSDIDETEMIGEQQTVKA